MENDNLKTRPDVFETSADVSELSPDVLESKPEAKKSKSKIVLGFLSVFLIAVFIFAFLNYVAIKDYFVGLSFKPTAEMSEIKEKLELTDRGSLIFNASFPTLESKDDFNRDCDSYDEEISVLGCFSKDRIYVYNITSSELSGILESTTAHELLHAIWSRLKGAEKAALTPVLEDVYKENRLMLEETLATYSESDRLDELYVRVGTQVSSLPEELETHYKKYFNNRANVVSFYESYVAPFNELNEKIKAEEKELAALKEEADALSKTYEEEADEFNKAVGEFNACASRENCYTEAEFYSRRAELVAEEKKLDEMYSELEAKIKEYNSKVEEYNKNVIKSNGLQEIINSNSAPSEIEE